MFICIYIYIYILNVCMQQYFLCVKYARSDVQWHLFMNRGSKWKNPPNQVKGMAKKNVTESKPTAISKKSCICSPTSHTGSFRCHLHRATITQKSPQPLVLLATSNKSNSSLCYYRSFSDGKPHLSRFARVAFPDLNNGFGKSN